MDNSPYLDRPLRTEAQARMERFRDRIEPAGPCDQQDNEPRAVQRRHDIEDLMNELSARLEALSCQLDGLTWNFPVEPDKKALAELAADVEELGRDLRAFAGAI